MKFSFKIFIVSFLIIIISLGVGGFLIINSTFISELNIQKESTISNNKFLAMLYYSISNTADIESPFGTNKYILREFQNISGNGEVFIGKSSDIKYFDESLFALKLSYNEVGSQVINKDSQKYFQVITKLSINDSDVYVENLADITDIYNLRDENYKLYCLFLLIVSLISSTIMMLFSVYITKPLKRLSRTNEVIAGGNFTERNNVSLKVMKSPELVSLAISFNFMADHIEDYIRKLKDYNKRQDDFISRFTHELKTPLTSIIGYSDILRTYDSDPSKRYEMANYIYKEGKRLEDLSFNLLNLILLKQDEFTFSSYNSVKFFNELKGTLDALIYKYHLTLITEIEETKILIVDSLLKSLIYNLVDNACKASKEGDKIIIIGKVMDNSYLISVRDFGKGIPKESLSKVTSPFYMVDKSRARKQGGAGLGLSLCEEIAKVHHSNLEIESVLGEGTTVSFYVEESKNEK